MTTDNATYGFIGLGQMGHGMAKNIRQKIPSSCRLFIYDVNDEAMKRFKQEFHDADNVVIANSPKEVGHNADIVLTSVPRAEHVREVFLNPDTGLLAGKDRERKSVPTLYLELSTIDAAVSNQVGKHVLDGGFGEFVDAPCSGGSMGAEKGILSFMVGCPEPLYPRVLSILEYMGKKDGIFHCGEAGTGLKTKLLNNYLSSITTVATAETINMGIRAGLDAQRLNAVLNASSGMSFNTKVNNPVPGLSPGNPASNGYKPGFAIEMCLGVLELALKAGEELGVKLVLGGPTVEAYRITAGLEKFKGKDAKIIYQWIAGNGDGVEKLAANGVH